MFKLAELFVDITARDQQVKSTVDGLQGKLSTMGVAIGTAAGNLVASTIASATGALTGFFSSGIKGAIDLQDTISAIGAVFGDSASVITNEADRMAAKFGVVKGEFAAAAMDFGRAFKSIGTATPEAAALGNQLAKLGMDMASFGHGTSNEEAFTALRAALRGEFDPLERFGIMLSAAAVENEALSLGLIKSAKDMDEAAKKQATLSLIMKKSTDQQGDLERTGDSMANQWRKFSGTITNLANDLGTTLQPAISAILAVGNEMAVSLVESFQGSKATFESFAASVSEGASTVGMYWRNLGDIWQIVELKAGESVSNIVAHVEALAANVLSFGEWFANNWVKLIQDGASAAMAIFRNLTDNAAELGRAIAAFLSDPTKGFHVDFKPLLEGFKATADALPDLVKPNLISMEKEIDAVAARIANREGARAAAVKHDVETKKVANAIAGAAGKKEKEFKSETMGAADFAMKLRESIFSGGKDDTAKKQLDEQKAIRKAAEKTADALSKGVVATLG